MRITISPSDGVPIYLQIAQQIRRLVAAGEMREGEELPSIRSLAERLVVNPNTIARAYRELEAEGVLMFSRGMGTFVAANDLQSISFERQSILAPKIDALLNAAHSIGINFDELLDLLRLRHATFIPTDLREKSHDR